MLNRNRKSETAIKGLLRLLRNMIYGGQMNNFHFLVLDSNRSYQNNMLQ